MKLAAETRAAGGTAQTYAVRFKCVVIGTCALRRPRTAVMPAWLTRRQADAARSFEATFVAALAACDAAAPTDPSFLSPPPTARLPAATPMSTGPNVGRSWVLLPESQQSSKAVLGSGGSGGTAHVGVGAELPASSFLTGTSFVHLQSADAALDPIEAVAHTETVSAPVTEVEFLTQTRHFPYPPM